MASKELQGFSQSLGSLGGAVSTFAKVGLAAVATAGVALVGGLGASINQAMNFEAAMSAVAAVAGASDSQLQQLSDTALKLGQDTSLSGVSATDAARAMRELAAAGLSVQDIVGGGALGALRLASAGGVDVARAAEIAAMALSGFGLAGTEAAHVADLFASAANSSAISVDDIAETMKYVAPIAKSMGLSIEEVTATIAALGNQGIKGSQAGTSLRSMIVSLAKPSKEAAKVMANLGLSFFDTNGEMKDLAGISQELQSKMSGLTDKQRASALATLFGNEALTAATVLYGEGAAGINKWLGEVTTGATAAEVGAKRNDNLKGSIEALKSSFETAQIVLGKAFLPGLKSLVDTAALAVSAAIPLIEAWGPRLVAGLMAAIGVLTSFGGYVASAIGAIVGAFKALQAGQISLGDFVGGLKALIGVVLGDIGGLLGKVAAFFAPYFAAIGSAIASALPAIAGQLAQLGQTFGGWITGTAIPYLLTNLPLWLGALTTWVTGTALPGIYAAVSGVGAAFGGWITGTAIPYLTTNLPLWLTTITTWVTGTAIPGIVAAVTSVGEAFGGWITATAIPYLTTNLPLWLAALTTWISGTVIPTVTGLVVGIGNALGSWISTAIGYLNERLPEWLAALGTWITGYAVPTVTGQVVGIANAMSDWIETQLIPRVNEKMPGFTTALIAQILDTQSKVNAPAEEAGQKIGERLGEGLIHGGVAGITKAVTEWQTTLKVLMLTSLPVAIAEAGAVLGPKLAEWIVTGAIPEAVKNFAQFEATAAVAIARMVAPLQTEMLRVGVGVAKGLLNGIIEEAQALWAWLSALPGRIAGAVGDMGSVLYQKGVDLVQGFINGILSKIGDLISTAGKLASAVSNPIVGFFDIHSPSKLAIGWGKNIVQGLINGMDEKQAEAAKKAAEIASSVAKAATDILGAIGAVASFDFANNSPSGETLGWFRHLAESIVQTLADVATMVGGAALDNAKKVAESTGQVGSAVKSTLDGFKALAEYDFTKGSPTGDAMGWFRHLMESIVLNFAQAAQLVGTDGMAQATAFAKVVADVVGSMKSSLELFAKLNDWKDIPTKALDALFKALEETLSKAGDLVARSDALKEAALEFLANMTAAAAAYQKGNGMAIGGPALAPSGVGGGGQFFKDSGGGGNVYTVTVQGDVYDGAKFQDKVVETLETIDRRGRI